MSDFFFGIQAIARGISVSLRQLFALQLFQGFIFGFALAIILAALVYREDFQHAVTAIRGDTSSAFSAFASSSRRMDGEYTSSYSGFKKYVNRVQVALYMAVASFFTVVIVSLIFY